MGMNINGPIYNHIKQTKQKDGKTLAYGAEDLSCIEQTLAELIKPVDQNKKRAISENLGLLLGKIQSGKTKSFIGLMGLAFENGFDVAVVLTKNSGALAKQTTKRLAETFAEFHGKIFAHDIMRLGNNGIADFAASQKLILVVKKQHKNVKKAIKLLTSENSLYKSKKILIIDDEADTASASYVGKDEEVEMAMVAGLVNDLRNKTDNSFFLQVTATPYSLFMQNDGEAIDGKDLLSLKPKFVKLVPVHKDYVGSDYYFELSKDKAHPASKLFSSVSETELDLLKEEPHRGGFKIETDCLTSDKIKSVREAVTRFIVAGCIRRLQQVASGELKLGHFALMFHTQAGKSSHQWQDRLIHQLVNDIVAAEANGQFDKLEPMFVDAYYNLETSIKLTSFSLPGLALVMESVKTAIREKWINVLCINSDEDVESHLSESTGELRLDSPLTIFVGGQYLDRGVTINGLIGFFYGRSPKSFQQDTVLQHCRQFGFRPPGDMAVTRFYTSTRILAALQVMHQTDVLLRKRIEEGSFYDCMKILEKLAGDGIKFCGYNKIKASRVNVVDEESRILPQGFDVVSSTDLKKINASIEKILAKAGITSSGKDDSGVLDLEDAKELVKLTAASIGRFTPGYETSWDMENINGLLQTFTDKNRLTNLNDSSERIAGKVGVLVRWNRERPQEDLPTDTPDNPRKDTDIARQMARKYPVILLLHQKGINFDWHGGPFFWPVLFPPAGNQAYMYALSASSKKKK
jgi:Z1 domain